jgi:hypothetical protein
LGRPDTFLAAAFAAGGAVQPIFRALFGGEAPQLYEDKAR